jgi:hypothetical protein
MPEVDTCPMQTLTLTANTFNPKAKSAAGYLQEPLVSEVAQLSFLYKLAP